MAYNNGRFLIIFRQLSPEKKKYFLFTFPAPIIHYFYLRLISLHCVLLAADLTLFY